MSKNLETMVEELSSLTVLEMAKLKELLEDKWGVKAQAAQMAMPMVAQAAQAPAAAEATHFQITLSTVPADKKIGAIKVLREVTGLGLKEAKDLVDGVPSVVKENSPKAEAEDIKKKLEDCGAKVVLKGV